MMGAEKTLVNVNKGQDAYSIIGNYILNHVTAIEDTIAVIQIDDVIIKELYMVGANGDSYWNGDWWEGEEDVALLDFFPVSDAERIKWIPCSERLPEKNGWYQVALKDGRVSRLYYDHKSDRWIDNVRKYMFELYDIYSKTTHKRITEEKEDVYWDDWVIAWMPMPEPYREDENNATDRR